LKNEIKILEKDLAKIKKKGYIKAKNAKETALMVLKRYLNQEILNITIKEDRENNNSLRILFKVKLEGKDKLPLKKLETKYGSYGDFRKYKYLDNTIRANSKSYNSSFRYKLFVDFEKEKVFLQIFDKDFTVVSKEEFYFSFTFLKAKLKEKLDVLLDLKYWVKKDGNKTYYKFYDYTIYHLKEFKSILKLLEEGTIWIKIKTDNMSRIKPIDYNVGIPFMIEEIDLLKMYQK